MGNNNGVEVPGFQLQDSPRIYVAAIPGRWLLERTTPSWRIDNPEIGFQRIVRERRAREIALAVLDLMAESDICRPADGAGQG